jgi:class 3 adenylate cyclase
VKDSLASVELLLDDARAHNLLVTIDDASADGALRLIRAFTESVARRARHGALAMMTMVSCEVQTRERDELRSLVQSENDVIRIIELGPLAAPEATELLARTFEVPPSPALVRSLLHRTRGNPAELIGLSRIMVANRSGEHLGSLDYRSADRLVRSIAGSSQLPASMQDGTRRVAFAINVLAEHRTSERIAAVADVPIDSIEMHLDELRNLGMIPAAFEIDGEGTFVDLVISTDEAVLATVRTRAGRLLATSDDERAVVFGATMLALAGVAFDSEMVHIVDRAARIAWDSQRWATYTALTSWLAEQSVASPATSTRYHLEAARGAHRARDNEACERHGLKAIELARRCGDDETWGEAARTIHLGLTTEGHHALDGAAIDEILLEYLEKSSGPPSGHASAHLSLAMSSYQRFDYAAATRHRAAVDEGLLAADTERIRLHSLDALLGLTTFDLRGAQDSLERMSGLAQSSNDRWTIGTVHGNLSLVLAARGDLRRAAVQAEITAEVATETRDWSEHAAALGALCLARAAQGQLRDAVQAGDRAWRSFERSRFTYSSITIAPTMAWSHAAQLDTDSALRWLERYRKATGFSGLAVATLMKTFLDIDVDHAALGSRSIRPDLAGITHAVAIVEGLAQAADPPANLNEAHLLLMNAYAGGMLFGLEIPYFLPRLIGVSTMFQGDLIAARSMLRDASVHAMSCGAEHELARTLINRAELASLADDEAGATLLIEQARDLASALSAAGLDLLVDRFVSSRRGTPRMDRFVVFTDIISSTEHNRRLGDEGWIRTLREHDARMERLVHRWRGETFKHTGDGLHAWFHAADDAAQCAIEMQQSLAAHPIDAGGVPLRIRASLVEGTLIRDQGDLFGAAMSLAARLCELADSESVLTTADVASRVGASVTCVAAGPTELRGLPTTDLVRIR